MSEASLQLFKILIKSSKSIKQRFEFLAENPIMSDFKFIVGTEKIEVPAHKYIFAATSFEFFNLFFLSEPTNTDIHLKEIKYESFKEFIRYVYSDDIKIVSANFFDILTLSLRYDMEHLTNLCLNQLPILTDDKTDDSFAGQFMEFFEIWNKEKVSDAFLSIIGRRPLDYVNQENVIKLKLKDVSVILKSEETETFEVDYFEFAMMWAEKQLILMKIDPTPTKNRLILENLFFQIRFPTMSLEEFQRCSADQNGLFTNEELFQIIVFINSNSSEPVACTNLEFGLKKRLLRVNTKVASFGNRHKSKCMMANITPETRTNVKLRYFQPRPVGLPLDRPSKSTSLISVLVKKSIRLDGINVLFHNSIMHFWDSNVRNLTCKVFIKTKQSKLIYSYIFKFDIPSTFSESFLEKQILLGKHVKLEASAEQYIILLEVTSSEEQNPDIFQSPYLYLTPVAEIVSANSDICEFIEPSSETAISNILFSLEKIKLSITTTDGRTFSVEVDPFDTTNMVKDAIYKSERIPRYEMRLLFNGTLLEDLEVIHTYGIINNSVLDLEI